MKPAATGKISPTTCQEDPGSHHHQLPDTQPPSTRVGTMEKDNQEKWRLESNWRKQLANAHEPSSPMSPDLLGGLVSPSSEASQLRRKTRPSPIHVPPSPSNLKESGPATTSHLPSTGKQKRPLVLSQSWAIELIVDGSSKQPAVVDVVDPMLPSPLLQTLPNCEASAQRRSEPRFLFPPMANRPRRAATPSLPRPSWPKLSKCPHKAATCISLVHLAERHWLPC